ncbi:ABC transporter ATP-binding protein [Kitasatospora sp. YST-16]|uniref:ABC transporter ATP-binding protein n=1 Tax=Kitasatospora sp. YST-16 TaxID=2998080 RepID=UPI002284E38A|nr:ABC transporter ATP-binding protein [Kitasatospora sp. YST-16]WAL73910.1 ABC transporter ATP-binding protein [Kitasatospora sp. YST-16]WNW39986.1 ABC transporter ATP-binding protein [Streptomyces sp. Li-HN-5-13]
MTTAVAEPAADEDDLLPEAADDQDIPVPPGAPRALLGSLLAPHRRRIAVAVLAVLLQQAALQAGPLLVAYAIDRGIPALRGHDAGPLIAVTASYLGCALLATLLQRAFIRVAARINQDVLLDLRGRIFRHAQRLSLDFHERYTSGRIISRATSDVDTLRELLAEGLQELLMVCLSVGYITVVLLVVDWRLGLVALVSFLPMYLVVRSFRRRSQQVYRRSRTAVASLIVRFTETMNGIRPVQAFRREAANDRAFATVNRQSATATADGLLEMARYVFLSRLTANVWITGVVVLGAFLVTDGSLELGVLTAFVLYLRRLYDPIDQLAMFLNSYQSAAAALEKMAGLLAHEPSVPEPAEPAELPAAAGKGREVAFRSVSFAYANGKQVLPPFDLVLPAGRTTAVVGATGAGKSTLAKLLARFYDPTSGAVALDGVDLRELSTDELRANVVMVTQESFLFSGTVAENIAVGKPDATRAEVEAAARAIGAHAFIAALPDGYDTDVRKRGGRISAGQRQLVAFARALLADPAVLILDEATSSLDVPGEQAVQHAMRTVLAGRTAVIIAHRLSTVEIADRVLVMDQGRVIEDGTPTALIAGEGRFATLHRTWKDSLV